MQQNRSAFSQALDGPGLRPLASRSVRWLSSLVLALARPPLAGSGAIAWTPSARPAIGSSVHVVVLEPPAHGGTRFGEGQTLLFMSSFRNR